MSYSHILRRQTTLIVNAAAIVAYTKASIRRFAIADGNVRHFDYCPRAQNVENAVYIVAINVYSTLSLNNQIIGDIQVASVGIVLANTRLCQGVNTCLNGDCVLTGLGVRFLNGRP